MGSSPWNGNSRVVVPTTANGGTVSAAARFPSRSRPWAAPATTRKSPATGLLIVAIVAYPVARTTRRSPTSSTHAARAKATPSANATRPAATLTQSPNAAISAGGSGRRMPDRTNSTAASQPAASPEAKAMVRTPKKPMKYGESRL
jgi:hypothetical protein